MDVELHDWEVLDDPTPLHNTTYLDGIERDSDGTIRSDYFSLDSHNTYFATHAEDVTDQVSVDSDNPSWIDPVCDVNYSKTKPIGEFWSTDGSDDGKYNELGFVYGESCSDLGEIESGHDVCEKTDALIDKVEGEERNRGAVWWKLPIDLLKYCLFKANPVWTVSVAAAMMSVVILGRRLYKMKQKTRSLQLLKVAIDDDDKKLSQVMSRVARLNDAFSVVKRAPIIRPSLPATRIAPWPVLALR